MKTLPIALLAWGLALSQAIAQKFANAPTGLPLTVSVFSESISLPTLRGTRIGGVGLKVGTEFYYRNRPGSQWMQTLNLVYYYHPRVQSGLSIHSEFGYRKYFGGLYADAFVGGGALLLRPTAPSYMWNEGDGKYRKTPSLQLKFMPTVAASIGYRFRNQAALFARYELFGEMPFSYTVLPHQALHLGVRLLTKK